MIHLSTQSARCDTKLQEKAVREIIQRLVGRCFNPEASFGMSSFGLASVLIQLITRSFQFPSENTVIDDSGSET